jgi:hypothetical protein
LFFFLLLLRVSAAAARHNQGALQSQTYHCPVYCSISTWWLHRWHSVHSKQRSIWILPSSGLLHSVGWLRTNVSGPIGNSETSVLNQPTLCNNPENGRIQAIRNANLRSGNGQLHCLELCCTVMLVLTPILFSHAMSLTKMSLLLCCWRSKNFAPLPIFTHVTSQIYTQSPLEFTLLVTVFLTFSLKVHNLQGKGATKPAGNWFQLINVLFTNEYLPTFFRCFLVQIFRLWSTLLSMVSEDCLPVYALKRAHIRAILLRCANVSQTVSFVLCANLAALFCKRFKALTWPSVWVPTHRSI